MASTTDPMEQLRQKCLARGAHGIKGIARIFRNMDDDGSRNLNYDEFQKGLNDFGVSLEDESVTKALFDKFDKDKNGQICFDEFLEQLRPPMSQTRKDIILKAFSKADKTGDGKITVEDLRGVYDVSQHAKVKSGEWTKDQAFAEFLKTFDSPNNPDGEITKEGVVQHVCIIIDH